jgi:putative transposase
MKGMQMLWGTKISHLAFAAFMNKIEYLVVKHDKEVKKVDRFYPSSKTYGCCGHVYKELTLKERSWKCSNCDTTHDRDLNAANTILMVGTSTIEGKIVRPALAG